MLSRTCDSIPHGAFALQHTLPQALRLSHFFYGSAVKSVLFLARKSVNHTFQRIQHPLGDTAVSLCQVAEQRAVLDHCQRIVGYQFVHCLKIAEAVATIERAVSVADLRHRICAGSPLHLSDDKAAVLLVSAEVHVLQTVGNLVCHHHHCGIGCVGRDDDGTRCSIVKSVGIIAQLVALCSKADLHAQRLTDAIKHLPRVVAEILRSRCACVISHSVSGIEASLLADDILVALLVLRVCLSQLVSILLDGIREPRLTLYAHAAHLVAKQACVVVRPKCGASRNTHTRRVEGVCLFKANFINECASNLGGLLPCHIAVCGLNAQLHEDICCGRVGGFIHAVVLLHNDTTNIAAPLVGNTHHGLGVLVLALNGSIFRHPECVAILVGGICRNLVAFCGNQFAVYLCRRRCVAPLLLSQRFFLDSFVDCLLILQHQLADFAAANFLARAVLLLYALGGFAFGIDLQRLCCQILNVLAIHFARRFVHSKLVDVACHAAHNTTGESAANKVERKLLGKIAVSLLLRLCLRHALFHVLADGGLQRGQVAHNDGIGDGVGNRGEDFLAALHASLHSCVFQHLRNLLTDSANSGSGLQQVVQRNPLKHKLSRAGENTDRQCLFISCATLLRFKSAVYRRRGGQHRSTSPCRHAHQRHTVNSCAVCHAHARLIEESIDLSANLRVCTLVDVLRYLLTECRSFFRTTKCRRIVVHGAVAAADPILQVLQTKTQRSRYAACEVLRYRPHAAHELTACAAVGKVNGLLHRSIHLLLVDLATTIVGKLKNFFFRVALFQQRLFSSPTVHALYARAGGEVLHQLARLLVQCVKDFLALHVVLDGFGHVVVLPQLCQLALVIRLIVDIIGTESMNVQLGSAIHLALHRVDLLLLCVKIQRLQILLALLFLFQLLHVGNIILCGVLAFFLLRSHLIAAEECAAHIALALYDCLCNGLGLYFLFACSLPHIPAIGRFSLLYNITAGIHAVFTQDGLALRFGLCCCGRNITAGIQAIFSQNFFSRSHSLSPFRYWQNSLMSFVFSVSVSPDCIMTLRISCLLEPPLFRSFKSARTSVIEANEAAFSLTKPTS